MIMDFEVGVWSDGWLWPDYALPWSLELESYSTRLQRRWRSFFPIDILYRVRYFSCGSLKAKKIVVLNLCFDLPLKVICFTSMNQLLMSIQKWIQMLEYLFIYLAYSKIRCYKCVEMILHKSKILLDNNWNNCLTFILQSTLRNTKTISNNPIKT